MVLGRNDTVVGDGPNLGGIHFYGNDTTNNDWTKLGAIDCASDGVQGPGDNPTKLTFATTADGSSTPTERLRIDSAGNVGIGTTSPDTVLDIEGVPAATTGGILRIRDTQTSSSAGKGGIHLSSSPGIDYYIAKDYDPANSPTVGLAFGNASSGAEFMRIDSSGNVGIGTTSPSVKLTTQDDSLTSTTPGTNIVARFQTNGNGRDASILLGDAVATASRIGQISGNITFHPGSATERMRIDSSGNVGIGTTSPAARLHIAGATGGGVAGVYDTTAGGARIEYKDNGTRRGFLSWDTNSLLLGVDSGNSLKFSTDAGVTQHATIDSSGNVGIGDYIPGSSNNGGAYFFNSGSVYSNRTLSTGSVFVGLLNGNATSEVLANGSATFDGTITSEGTYNNTSTGSPNMYVHPTNYQFHRSTSSIKYKTNVETIEDQYSDAILNCRPVWYQSLCEADNPDFGHWGFIAEEVAEIDPRLVHYKEEEDGTLEPEGVQYDRFVPHLLNLIKRQQQAIETLEAKVAALEAG